MKTNQERVERHIGRYLMELDEMNRSECPLLALEGVAMDMSPPYIAVTKEELPEIERKIVFN